MRARSNSAASGYVAKEALPDSDEYSARVATPIMQAVDAMPSGYRSLVNELGYIDVYRAWRRGWSPAQIAARSQEGFFRL